MSTGQGIGAIAGAVIGYLIPGGSVLMGAAIGSAVGAAIDPAKVEGPRLDDLRVQMSSYGSPIPVEWGVNRHAGTVIWPKALELKDTEGSGGDKGEVSTHTYSCSIAVLISDRSELGPIAGVRRIWANKKLVYDASANSTGPNKDPAIGAMRIYLGTEDQEADPLIEATDGPSPAYLGSAYVVFEDYDLTDAGNRPPQFEFEVITEGDASNEPPVRLGNGGMTRLYTNPSTGEQTLWSVSGSSVYVYSLPGGELIQTIALPYAGTSITSITGEIWVGHSQSGGVAGATPINPATYALGASTNFGYVGAISKLGTVVANGLVLYGFVNNGVGAGGVMYPTNTASGISVPHYVFFSLEMPDIFKAALAGFGNWVTIADFATDTTAATVYNPAWGSTVQGHRFAHDATRNALYWASVGSANVYKIDLAVYTLSTLITVAGVQGMHYNAADDTIYVDAGTGLNAYSPESGALTGTIAEAGVLVGQFRGTSIDVGSAEYYFVSENGSPGALWKINLRGALAPAKIPLSQIVGDICNRAGLDDADIDVSQLTDLVDGYIVPRQMSARAAIEPLQQAFYFDAVESDDTLKFVKRGINAPALIPMESRSAREFGADLPDSVSVVRAQDMELPVQVDVEYPDVDADHLIGNQYDRRITKDTKQRVNLQLPIVMDAEKAKQVAIVNLYALWLNESYKFTTTREYAHLEPTDLVTLPTTEASYTARILTKREQPNGIIEWEAKKEGVSVYTQSGAGAAPTNYVKQSLPTPGTTVLELMDLPLLRDQDAGKGFPVAMAGTSASWPGAQLFKSTDAGSTYGALFSQAEAAVIGRATTVLGDFTGGDIFDDGNSLTVTVGPGSTLINYSTAQILEGAGAFALGVNGRQEIIQYRNAELIAPLTYTLTGFLRGRKGTEWAAGTHQLNDHFVMLSAGGIQFYDPGADDAGIERLYKAPAFRAALSTASAVPFTDTRLRLRPYSVANLRVDQATDGYLISWAGRSIVGGGWRDGGDVVRDAAFIAFDVTLLTAGGAAVKTYSVTDESIAYTGAMAALDFGYVPATFQVRVAQRNGDYGQGIGVTVASDGSAFAYDVPAPQQTPTTPGAPGASAALIAVKSVRMIVQSGSPYTLNGGSTVITGPYYIRSSLIYEAPAHGLQVGDYVWRQDMPELIYQQGYSPIGPFGDADAAPPAAGAPGFRDFLIFNQVREVTADTFTLYDLDSFQFENQASAYLQYSQKFALFAAGVAQRVAVNGGTVLTDDPFAVPPPAVYARPLAPYMAKLWDGTKFVAEAYGPDDTPGTDTQRLMTSTTGTSSWTLAPASGSGHGSMAHGAGKHVAWSGWFGVSTDNLATWTRQPMWDFPLHQTQGGIQFSRVHYLNGEFVAVGERGIIVTSTDGLTWTEADDGSSPAGRSMMTLVSAAFDGTHYVVAGFIDGQYPVILRGTSLGALSRVDLPHTGYTYAGSGYWGAVSDLAYNSGRFVVVGRKLHMADGAPENEAQIRSQPYIATSTDGGATWTDVSFTGSFAKPTRSFLAEVVRCGSIWLATGSNVSATSTDGVTWTERPHLGEYRYSTVTNGSTVLTTINQAGVAANNFIWTSTDCVNFTKLPV
jgi:hypothetical protein